MAYGYKRTITIDHTKCGSSTSSNFPALVYISDATFKTTGNGGRINNANGYDIAFYSDSSGTSSLYWEIEAYNGATGELWAWVKIPSLSHTTDTVIYVFYGDSGISTFQSTSSSVWDSNFKSVYHLPDGSTLSANDSTSNANNGTVSGASATTGKIKGGASFNGSSNSIAIGSASGVTDITSNITISAWINPASLPSTNGFAYIVGKGYDGNPEQYALRLSNEGAQRVTFTTYTGGITYGATWTHGGSITTGTWYHIVGLFNGSAWKIYSDGSEVASTSSATGPARSTKGTYIGATDIAGSVSRWFNGYIDEVRISDTARSADWILAEYNSQNSPSTFLALGSETSAGGGGGGSSIAVIAYYLQMQQGMS